MTACNMVGIRALAFARIRTGCAVLAAATLAASCSADAQALKAEHVANGDRYVAAGKMPEAVVEYRSALQQDDQDALVREKLADLLLAQKKAGEALKEYQRAADLAPDNDRLQLKAGNLLLVAGNFVDAKARADAVLARDEKSLDANLLKAKALIGLKDVPGALAQVEDAIQANPDRGEVYTNLGAIELGRGERAAAEAAFRKAIELAPDSLQAQLAFGTFAWMTGQWKEAEDALKKAVVIAPKDPIANRALANFFLATNRAPEAETPLVTNFENRAGSADAFALADYYVLVGRLPDAKAILEPLTRVSETGSEARIRLATIGYRSGQHQAAYDQLDAVLKTQPANSRALIVRARLLQLDGRFDDALKDAQAATAADPKSTAAFFLVGQLQNQLRHASEARAAFEQVLQLNPRASDAQLELSKIHLATGDVDTSLGLARSAVQATPNNPDARLAMARALLAKGDLDGAEKELNALATAYPQAAAVQSELGMLYGRRNNQTAARKAFENARALDPANGQATLGLIALDLMAKQPAQAKSLVDDVVNHNPSAAGLVLGARVYAATGDADGAERLLRQAIQKDANYLPAYVGLGQFYVARGRLDAALAEFQNVTRQNPRAVAAETMVGIIMQAQGNVEGARQEYEKTLSMDPEAAVAANNLAWILAEADTDLLRAEDLARTAVGKLPDNPSVNDTLGFVLLQNGRSADAIKPLEQSVAGDPSNALYHYHLGKAYLDAGQADKAKASLSRALALNAAFDGAADARALLAIADVAR